MKCEFVLLAALAVLATGFQYTEEWKAWKKEYGRTYRNDEVELHRHIIWENNMHFVKEHNAHVDELGFAVEMNEFADMESGEFAQIYNGYRGEAVSHAVDNTTVRVPQSGAVPDTVDWRTKGVVSEIKNQGQCGSCWSFSTTGSLEGQHAINTGKLVSLSEQQLVDCSKKFGNNGCGGGLMTHAFKYLETVKGDESENDYPYKAEDGKCKYDESKAVVGDKGYKKVFWADEWALKEAVANVGPISVGIDARWGSFQLYKNGVYNEPKCSEFKLDHGVLVVGYGTKDGKDYWLVKNSWGKKWGMSGYIMMSRNKRNQCGIASQASYPTSVN